MKSLIRIALLAAIPALATSVSAQQPWSVELRGGGAFPTVDMVGDLGTGNGIVIEGNLAYDFLPFLGAFVGWDWVGFSPENSFAGTDIDFEGTGYLAGLRYQRGVTEAIEVWLRAAVRYDHLELEDEAGDIVAGTDRDVGLDVGLGLAVDINDAWALTPGVRYRAVTHDVQTSPSRTDEAEFRHVILDVGVAYRFGF